LSQSSKKVRLGRVSYSQSSITNNLLVAAFQEHPYYFTDLLSEVNVTDVLDLVDFGKTGDLESSGLLLKSQPSGVLPNRQGSDIQRCLPPFHRCNLPSSLAQRYRYR
jgi:hypothetical protein